MMNAIISMKTSYFSAPSYTNWMTLSKPLLTLDLMLLIQRKNLLYKRIKQNASSESVYQAYCSTLCKKVDEAIAVNLKKIKLIAIK